MNDMQKAARLVLHKFIENGTAEELQGFKETAEELQRKEPTEETESLLQALEKAINKRQQEG